VSAGLRGKRKGESHGEKEEAQGKEARAQALEKEEPPEEEESREALRQLRTHREARARRVPPHDERDEVL
jgi:hypothetical protein